MQRTTTHTRFERSGQIPSLKRKSAPGGKVGKPCKQGRSPFGHATIPAAVWLGGCPNSVAGRVMRVSLLLAGLMAFGPPAFPADKAEAGFPRTEDYDYEAPAPGSYKLPVVKAAADGSVLDSKGRRWRLRELTRGRVTVISFIYTRCAAAKACPYATGVLAELHRVSAEDSALAPNLRLISMSFDSEGDRPEQMAAYSALAEVRQGAAEWLFLTTPSQAALRPILKAYDQAVDKRANPADPEGPLYHTLRVFLIDAAGNIRNIYSAGTLDPRLVLADVRTLLLERSTPGAGKPDGRSAASGSSVTD